jgi:Sec-independent protein translocase protein TatA
VRGYELINQCKDMTPEESRLARDRKAYIHTFKLDTTEGQEELKQELMNSNDTSQAAATYIWMLENEIAELEKQLKQETPREI